MGQTVGRSQPWLVRRCCSVNDARYGGRDGGNAADYLQVTGTLLGWEDGVLYSCVCVYVPGHRDNPRRVQGAVATLQCCCFLAHPIGLDLEQTCIITQCRLAPDGRIWIVWLLESVVSMWPLPFDGHRVLIARKQVTARLAGRG